MTHTEGGEHRRPAPHDFEQKLREAIEELARDMHGEHASLAKTLDIITAGALELIPGAEHAGITLATRDHRFDSRAATSELPRRIDRLQYHLQDGPCIQAIWDKATIRVNDLSTEDRWPRFATEATALGVRSMLSFRLYTTGTTLGALNLHSTRPHAFDDENISIGTSIATHAALAVVAALREEQFRTAQATRDVIGQAKGILMHQFRIDADAAFDLLRRLSQERNQPLHDIATELVATAPTDPDHEP